MKTFSISLALAATAALAACGATSESSSDDLFAALSARCGQAYEGNVLGDDPRDADWRSERMVMHIRECSDDEIRIPLHVGDNRSRTWVVTRQGEGLRLKHDHRHEDGSEDVLTQYGGDTDGVVTGLRAEFPADAFSRELFVREGIAVSADNVWLMEIDGDTFTYGLTRPDRNFRAVFDLSRPVDAPPAPWGFED
ncbi:MAG: hypothetical protein CMF74_14780 [Maricaulis sp.]|nr:hypothetical protein [Maricaulis sp.]